MRLAKTRLLSTLALAMKLLHAAPVLVAFLCISHTFGLKSSMQPTSVSLVPNTSITRRDSSLMLNGERWTISGANVYWLGLDENVIPPAGQPFYAPLNASYPTFGRITEIMNTLLIMGATTIRGHTLGISVGNPLSVMPELGVVNEQAFDTMDWAIYEAGRHGLRIFAPLIDNYVSSLVANHLHLPIASVRRITTMVVNTPSSAGLDLISPDTTPPIPRSCSSILTSPSSTTSKTTSK